MGVVQLTEKQEENAFMTTDNIVKIAAIQSTTTMASTKKQVQCGACGQYGHNCPNATCNKYYSEKEIDRRAKMSTAKKSSVK